MKNLQIIPVAYADKPAVEAAEVDTCDVEDCAAFLVLNFHLDY